MPLTSPLILDIGERASVSPYTVWLLFLIEAAVPTREAYAQAGLSEENLLEYFSGSEVQIAGMP